MYPVKKYPIQRNFIALLLMVCILFSCKESSTITDYALHEQRDQWSHHYAFGSPSWDSFERYAGNPVYEGRKGMEWPVNGFIFNDPVSKHWFLYIGEYRENYFLETGTDRKDLNCVIYESADKGITWTKKGDLFPNNQLAYGGLKIEAPDVMVVYADGKYHMIFDWVPKDITWSNTDTSGLGYAVSDKPEGPFVISEKPLKINTEYKDKPKLGKYARMYAAMIVKREKDWAIIHMFDTKPARAWALAVATSDKPEGPYTDSKLVLNVEGKTAHPPLQEFYPAFTHDGYVYFPATSVAVNRNYQSVYRVKTEDLTNPDKYELFTNGSFFHGTTAPHEYAGIWGQTMSGFVDNDSLYIMYPSKNTNNYGTINLAKASWSHFSRDTGFALSSHEEKSFSYIKKVTDLESINTDFTLDGTLHLLWDFNTPIDILSGWGKFSFQDNDPDYKEVVVSKAGWKVNVYEKGKGTVLSDSGKIVKWNDGINNLQFKKEGENYSLYVNADKAWTGAVKASPGVVGVMLDPHSYLFASKFEMSGKPKEGIVTYGFYEALLSAGNQDADWTFSKDSSFLNNRGAISKKDTAIAKWSFDGKGFELFSPKGPQYGTVNIYLDGKLVETVSLKSENITKSASVFKSGALTMGKAHTVFLEGTQGLLPLDCIKVTL